MTLRAALGVAGCVLALSACAGDRLRPPALADAAQAERSPGAQEAKRLAPQAFAEAAAERRLADQAFADGDDVAASLHAEQAIAGYQRALMLARLARATTDLTKATAEQRSKEQELRSLTAARTDADKAGDDLQKRIAVARELRAPAPAGPADAKREAARMVAARSLAVQARLLCGAAHLVSPSLAGLEKAEHAVSDLEKKLDAHPKTAPIDDAAQARVSCLDLLTHARRSTVAAGKTAPDALLAELSAAGMSPSRDERGVVVTLRDVFHGNAVTPQAKKQLESLGRVAAAHADVGVQVVVHEATPRAGGEARAKTAAAALVSGGAAADKVVSEDAGTRAPIVDPADTKNRGRNTRVEIVFVTR